MKDNLFSLRFMICKNPYLWIVFYIIVIGSTACSDEGKIGNSALYDEGTKERAFSRKLDLSSPYDLNPISGDSVIPILTRDGVPIKSGVPIYAKGRLEESMQEPFLKVPARWKKLETDRKTNVKKIRGTHIQSALVMDTISTYIDSSFLLINQVQDTIPTGVPIKLEGKKTLVKYPRPTQTLPPILHYESGLNLKSLNVDQGLNLATISGMSEGKNGDIWISYWGGGMSKYDGRSIWHFTIEQGLPIDLIWDVFVAKDGKVWILTQDLGVIVFDGTTFTQYSPTEGFPSDYAREIFEDSKGNIWLITTEGLTKYDGEAFTHFSLREGLIGGKIFRAFERANGEIWAVTKDGVSKFDGTSFINVNIRHPKGKRNILPFLEDEYGNLWFTSSVNELLIYNGNTFKLFPIGIIEHGGSWMEDKEKGEIWFAKFNEGLYKYDGEDLLNYTIINEFQGRWVTKILKDRGGNIWFSINGEGCYLLKENSFNHLDNLPGLGSLAGGKRNKLWMGVGDSDGIGGFYEYDGNHLSYLEGSTGEVSYRYILEDSKGNIWMALYEGIAKYDGEMLTYFTEGSGNSNSAVNFIFEDSKGYIWFAQNDGVLLKFDGDNFIRFDDQQGLPPHNYTSILEDQHQTLWFGMNGGGLLKYDPDEEGTNGSFTILSEKEGLSTNRIVNLFEDKEEAIWIGTSEAGMIRLKDATFSYLTKSNGLSHNSISFIFADSSNNLWAGTNNGLNVLVKKKERSESLGNANLENSLSAEYSIYTFNKNDGLKDISFKWNRWAMNPRGEIWLTNSIGNTNLNTSNFSIPAEGIPVNLEFLDVNGQFLDFRVKEQFKSSQLDFEDIQPFFNYPLNPTFSYLNNQLTFHFSSTDWHAPHKIKYSYRIPSLDNNWSIPALEPKADFRNLPPGFHTFEVRAMGVSQKWGKTFTYAFRILPPWWQTWWAYLLYVLIISAIIGALYRIQLRRQFERQETENLRKLDDLKNQLYTNITHEFKTPLTVINGMVEQIDGYKKATNLIKRNSTSLLTLVNQILDLRKMELGKLKLYLIQADIVSYLQYILESYKALAEKNGINLHFLSKKSELFMDFDKEKILRIISNLLSNAIKFTPEGGDIYLRLDVIQVANKGGLEEDMLQISVKDTGVGIPNEQQKHIFDRFYQVEKDSKNVNTEYQYRGPGGGTGIGLAMTKELVSLFQGTIEVKSKEGQGTTFMVVLPISRDASLITNDDLVSDNLPTGNIDDTSVEDGEELIASLSTANPSQSLSLLIIEDSPDVAQYLVSILEKSYDLILAKDGEEGIALALEKVPDLIISDVMMPKKDGYEVCGTLKQDTRTSHIPIVLLTAKSSVQSRVEGLRRGADAYLSKPFNQEELFIRLQKLTELRILLRARYQGMAPVPELTQPETKENPFQEEDEFIKKLRQFIDKNMHKKKFGIPELCKMMEMSRTQLHLKIKALTGKSTSLYIRSMRLTKAKKLLESTEMSITDVAFEVGFGELSYFSRKFSEGFGMSPKKYVESLQKE